MKISTHSTDASIFEINPICVVYPRSQIDLVKTVKNLLGNEQHLTMRAGGTSIAGQAIGSGAIVDVSKHLTNIIKFSHKDMHNAKVSLVDGRRLAYQVMHIGVSESQFPSNRLNQIFLLLFASHRRHQDHQPQSPLHDSAYNIFYKTHEHFWGSDVKDFLCTQLPDDDMDDLMETIR